MLHSSLFFSPDSYAPPLFAETTPNQTPVSKQIPPKADVQSNISLDFQNSVTEAQKLITQTALDAVNKEDFQVVLKSWFLYKAYSHNHNEIDKSVIEAEMIGSLWVSLANLGLCAENVLADDGQRGPNLWPIAFHNVIAKFGARSTNRKNQEKTPWDDFSKGLQTRWAQVNDVLSADEIKSFKPLIRNCEDLESAFLQGKYSSPLWNKLNPRTRALYMLYKTLKNSMAITNFKRVAPKSLVEGRLLDIHLNALKKIPKNDKDFLPHFLDLNELISSAKMWSSEDWLQLNSNRRLNLMFQIFDGADSLELEHRNTVILQIIDAETTKKNGAEVASLIGLLPQDMDFRQKIWEGERGNRLVSLDEATGFYGRSSLLLHKGIAFFESGRNREALENISAAIAQNGAEKTSEEVKNLARRWLVYILDSYQVDETIMEVLVSVLPREDANMVLESLGWSAALHHDAKSHGYLISKIRGRPAWLFRLEKLGPLAKGNTTDFMQAIEKTLTEEPTSALKFLTTLLEHLESSNLGLREKNKTLLVSLQFSLSKFSRQNPGRGSGQKAEELLRLVDSLLKGLNSNYSGRTVENSLRGLSNKSMSHIGVVRVAPMGNVPWPFEFVAPELDSVFEPFHFKVTKCCKEGIYWKISEK